MAKRKDGSSDALPEHMVKGNLIEQIIEHLHQDPDVIVGAKVKLPSRSNLKRRREIDVLVTGHILGRPMHLAFECKNYGERIGVGKIDEFKGKLEDVGIPFQYGIFVASESGFTRDARDRASSLGIRLLLLEGLTADRLSIEVHEAFQSLVFLMLSVKHIKITNEASSGDALEMLFLRDKNDEVCGSILDLIWAKWRDGKIPTHLGQHQIEMEIPSGWRWVIGGQNMPSTANAVVEVTAHVIKVEGKAERFVLRDAMTGEIDRGRINTSFDDERTSFPVVNVDTEDELAAALDQTAVTRVTIGRIPLPRIRYSIYWPPSGRVWLELKSRSDELVRQGKWRPGILEGLPFEEFEGTDLSSVWEPIWAGHPAAKDMAWPWAERPSRSRTKPSAPRRDRKSKRRA